MYVDELLRGSDNILGMITVKIFWKGTNSES